MKSLNKNKQQGGGHLIAIVVIIVLGLISLLGFFYWQNFVSLQFNTTDTVGDPDPKSKIEPTKKTSEIIQLENSDMNRYVNYEKGFEFLFPKQILTNNQCQEFNARRDNYGNWYPSERHYGGADGAVDVIILESGDEYIMAPKHTVVQSSPKGSDEEGYIFTSCEVVPTTVQIIERTKKDNYGIENIGLEYRSFRVSEAKNYEDALAVSRNIFNDPNGTVLWFSDGVDDRQSGEFKYDPKVERSGGFAYNLWYYPEKNKLAYIMFGHSRWFAYLDGSNNTYDDRVVESFKLLSE